MELSIPASCNNSISLTLFRRHLKYTLVSVDCASRLLFVALVEVPVNFTSNQILQVVTINKFTM